MNCWAVRGCGKSDDDGLMLGSGMNGMENEVLSDSSNSPPSTINAPFDVTV